MRVAIRPAECKCFVLVSVKKKLDADASLAWQISGDCVLIVSPPKRAGSGHTVDLWQFSDRCRSFGFRLKRAQQVTLCPVRNAAASRIAPAHYAPNCSAAKVKETYMFERFTRQVLRERFQYRIYETGLESILSIEVFFICKTKRGLLFLESLQSL